MFKDSKGILTALMLLLLILVAWLCFGCIAMADENTTPPPKFKFGDIVKVTLPFYANCSTGIVTDLDPFSITPKITHTYYLENIDCPVYDKDLHRTEWRRLNLEVAEEDLKEAKYHILKGK
jgi:hypothetical protein